MEGGETLMCGLLDAVAVRGDAVGEVSLGAALGRGTLRIVTELTARQWIRHSSKAGIHRRQATCVISKIAVERGRCSASMLQT